MGNSPQIFEEHYLALAQTRPELPASTRELLANCWDGFAKGGFPATGRRSELWKYTNVAALADGDFAIAPQTTKITREQLTDSVPFDDNWTVVVLENGRYAEKTSNLPANAGVKVMSLADACQTAPKLVENHLARHATDTENPFIALNTALIADGAVVHIEPNATVKNPIQIVYINSPSDAKIATFPRVLVVAGANSHCTLLETFVNPNTAEQLLVGVGEFALEESATMQHYRAQLDGQNAYHISHTRISQAANTTFNSVSLACGSKIGRYDIKNILTDTHSESAMYGLYMTAGAQHQSSEISTTHEKPHCTSRQFFKGILSGKSQAVFSGKVTVAKHAIKTDAEQKDLNLLLSRGAEIDTKPSLEIYADDVKCGHGATAGYLDEMTLFYLQSRGLDFATAMKIQAYGFASEIVDMVTDAKIAQFFEDTIDRALPKLLKDSDYNQ